MGDLVDGNVAVSPEKAFSIALGCLGWADPANGIWFVGLEESIGFNFANEQQFSVDLRNYDCRIVQDPALCTGESTGKRRVPVAEYVSKIAAPLSRKHMNGRNEPDWATYKRTMLWHPASGVANLNLYPLGKKKLGDSFPHEYFSRFGINGLDEYLTRVIKERFPLFQRTKDEYRPQAIVCFGKDGWDDFRSAFSLNFSDRVNHQTDGDIEVYMSGIPVILTRHFANGMKNSTSEAISEMLRGYNVSLP